MAEDLFTEAANPNAPTGDEGEVKTFLNKYVGEGKKYKSVEDLAKGYENADGHIDKLTGELSGLREFMTAQFEQINQRKTDPNPNTQPNDDGQRREPAAGTPPKGNDGEDDLDARIAKALLERDESKRLQSNAEITQDAMIQHYGSKEDAVKAIQTKATEMGVNPQFLADAAFKSPKAFFNLMGINPDEKPRSNATPNPSSDVNARVVAAANGGVAKPGTYEYFDNLRKTDKNKYWSSEVQAAMMKAALADPASFFKR